MAPSFYRMLHVKGDTTPRDGCVTAKVSRLEYLGLCNNLSQIINVPNYKLCKLGTLPVVLGYHLEWKLLGEVVSHDTDESKEPGKQKPIWQDPSKEVAKIFDSATKTGILDRS
ncbi:hypothetical protein C2G38_2157723 [Gigaspora rosea]|uniref:Uncharacterized protein n=1 Tax=Gigaspora rosea TaxID=44941 RepID=A0A397W2S5_9GLOM|nr:hypothetical protein C2G38_2157723 [Gigaspora rosea]